MRSLKHLLLAIVASLALTAAVASGSATAAESASPLSASAPQTIFAPTQEPPGPPFEFNGSYAVPGADNLGQCDATGFIGLEQGLWVSYQCIDPADNGAIYNLYVNRLVR